MNPDTASQRFRKEPKPCNPVPEDFMMGFAGPLTLQQRIPQ